MIICSEEMDRMRESVENGELHENDIYCDYDDYEDEYGHNYIDEEQRNFIREANKFFAENQIRYVAKYGVENVRIFSLRDEEHWSDYELWASINPYSPANHTANRIVAEKLLIKLAGIMEVAIGV